MRKYVHNAHLDELPHQKLFGVIFLMMLSEAGFSIYV